MVPVVIAMQAVVAIQAFQAVLLLFTVIYLTRRLKAALKAAAADISWRDQAHVQPLARELLKLEASVRGARAESATYLEAVFSGVRGLAQNLDVARATASQTLEEVRRRPGAAVARPPPFPPPPDDDGDAATTLDEARPVNGIAHHTIATMLHPRRPGSP